MTADLLCISFVCLNAAAEAACVYFYFRGNRIRSRLINQTFYYFKVCMCVTFVHVHKWNMRQGQQRYFCSSMMIYTWQTATLSCSILISINTCLKVKNVWLYYKIYIFFYRMYLLTVSDIWGTRCNKKIMILSLILCFVGSI